MGTRYAILLLVGASVPETDEAIAQASRQWVSKTGFDLSLDFFIPALFYGLFYFKL